MLADTLPSITSWTLSVDTLELLFINSVVVGECRNWNLCMEGASISVPLTPVSLKIDSEVEREGHPDSMGFPIKSSISLWNCKQWNLYLHLQRAHYATSLSLKRKTCVFCFLQVKGDVLEKLLPGRACFSSFQLCCTISISQCLQVVLPHHQTVMTVSRCLLNLSVQGLFQESERGNKLKKLSWYL